ncbi:FxLYD domain-containing protein [Dyella amyloliquefaciens]|uniref:FxLYD domain-containing protein n=1 Tax=Dyella amyloliquefaciens TaxID=1770545 RepID=UPI00102E602D|nr:FxLYD domain-containing protein [Dyella amyloliquefaciens]
MNLRTITLFAALACGLASPAAWAGKSPTHAVRVGSYRVERDVKPGRNRVVGTLSNTGRVRVHTARVSFRLFDAKGRAIGRATDEVHNLKPGQTWKFHALARGNVSRARLLKVEAQ